MCRFPVLIPKKMLVLKLVPLVGGGSKTFLCLGCAQNQAKRFSTGMPTRHTLLGRKSGESQIGQL